MPQISDTHPIIKQVASMIPKIEEPIDADAVVKLFKQVYPHVDPATYNRDSLQAALRLLAERRRVLVFRKGSSYLYAKPGTEAPAGVRVGIRATKGRGVYAHKAAAPKPAARVGVGTGGCFAILQLANKVIEFDTFDELGEFIDAMRSAR